MTVDNEAGADVVSKLEQADDLSLQLDRVRPSHSHEANRVLGLTSVDVDQRRGDQHARPAQARVTMNGHLSFRCSLLIVSFN